MTTEAELEIACCLLGPLVRGCVVRSIAVVKGSLDVCVFFRERPHPRLQALRIATGGPERARVGLEECRLRHDEVLVGETPHRLEADLIDARLLDLRRLPGERRLELDFAADHAGALRLVAECFGPHGNWFLTDPSGTIRALARRPSGARADLAPGIAYRAPPVRAGARATPSAEPPVDGLGWLVARSERFADLDRRRAAEALAAELARDLERERKGLHNRLRGLAIRQAAEAGADELRREADLLLAVPDPKRRGLASLEVMDWYAGGTPRVVELDPKLSVRENAAARFDRARRLAEGAAHTAGQIANASDRLARLEALSERLDVARQQGDASGLAALEPEIVRLVRRPGTTPARPRRVAPRKPYLEFRTAENLPVYVGRTNQDNDRLTLRIARGNDLWLHVAGGIAGSHVVIRVERGKTASLESLLDAATLALHFSKARGRPAGEVLYTPRKHVHKPKGSPPGRVEVLRSKTLQVRIEPERLRRVLASGEGETE